MLEQLLLGPARQAEGAVLRVGGARVAQGGACLLEEGLVDGAAAGEHGRGGVSAGPERQRRWGVGFCALVGCRRVQWPCRQRQGRGTSVPTPHSPNCHFGHCRQLSKIRVHQSGGSQEGPVLGGTGWQEVCCGKGTAVILLQGSRPWRQSLPPPKHPGFPPAPGKPQRAPRPLLSRALTGEHVLDGVVVGEAVGGLGRGGGGAILREGLLQVDLQAVQRGQAAVVLGRQRGVGPTGRRRHPVLNVCLPLSGHLGSPPARARRPLTTSSMELLSPASSCSARRERTTPRTRCTYSKTVSSGGRLQLPSPSLAPEKGWPPSPLDGLPGNLRWAETRFLPV